MHTSDPQKSWLPFSRDSLFQILAVAVFFIPLVFLSGLYEWYETAKIAVLFVALAAALCAAFPWRRRESFPVTLHFRTSFSVLLGLVALWVFFAVIPATDHRYALFGASPRYIGALFFIGWVLLATLLIGSIHRDKAKRHYLVQLLVVDGLAIGTLGILQVYGHAYYVGITASAYLLRPPSLLGNADYVGLFLAAVVPLAVWMVELAPGTKAKIFWAFALTVQLWALVMVASRGALLAAAGELLALSVWAILRKSKTVAATAVASMCTLGILTLLFLPLVRSQPAVNQTAIDERLSVWQEGLHVVAAHPFFGVGFGSVYVTVPNDGGYFDDVHNMFLQAAVTAGLPFMVLLTAVVLYPLALGTRAAMDSKADGESGFELGYVAIAELGFLVAGSFTPISVGCWLLLAVLLAIQVAPSADRAWKTPPSGAVTAGAWVLAAACAVYAVSFTASQYLLGQGLVQATRGTVTAEREMLAWSTRLYPVDAQAQDAYMLLTLHSARQIQTYASVHPHAAQTTNDEADAYWQLGDWNTALAYRQEEVDGNPYSEAVDEKLVGEYISASRFSEARSADQRALELLPAGGDANLWILLAKIDAEQGNAKSSRNCLESAYRSDPTNFQLKHVLQRSKSDLSAAVSYALSVES